VFGIGVLKLGSKYSWNLEKNKILRAPKRSPFRLSRIFTFPKPRQNTCHSCPRVCGSSINKNCFCPTLQKKKENKKKSFFVAQSDCFFFVVGGHCSGVCFFYLWEPKIARHWHLTWARLPRAFPPIGGRDKIPHLTPINRFPGATVPSTDSLTGFRVTVVNTISSKNILTKHRIESR
jgi:hypothetical protein